MTGADPSTIDFGDWPLPPEWLTELGRISTAWGSLESGVDLYTAKLAGFDIADPRALIVLKHSSFQQKLDTLAALCDFLQADYPWLSGYKDTIARIRSAQTLRNRYIHNGIDRDPETGKYHLAVASARGKLKTALEEITLPDLKSASMRIHEALLSLHALVTKKVYPPMWS